MLGAARYEQYENAKSTQYYPVRSVSTTGNTKYSPVSPVSTNGNTYTSPVYQAAVILCNDQWTLHNTREAGSNPSSTLQYTVRLINYRITHRVTPSILMQYIRKKAEREIMARGEVEQYVDINIWTPCNRQRASACHSKERERKTPNSEKQLYDQKERKRYREDAKSKGAKGHQCYRISKYWVLLSRIISIHVPNTEYCTV